MLVPVSVVPRVHVGPAGATCFECCCGLCQPASFVLVLHSLVVFLLRSLCWRPIVDSFRVISDACVRCRCWFVEMLPSMCVS